MSNFMDHLTVPIITYTKFWKRFCGMMFIKKKLSYGICFPHCNSIHTFFMRQPIDVVMTTREGTVLYYSRLKPWRIVLPKKKVYYTYEFSEDLLTEELKKELSL